jgi:hypothetical protein
MASPKPLFELMAMRADHGPMFQIAVLAQATDVTRQHLRGWGPPELDAPGACPPERRRYAAKAPRSSRAARAVFSAVIPSFSRTSAPGALAPKRSIDTVRSTQRSHP